MHLKRYHTADEETPPSGSVADEQPPMTVCSGDEEPHPTDPDCIEHLLTMLLVSFW